MSDFTVPPEFINQPVVVFARIPIPARDPKTGEQTISFPQMVGTLKQDLPGALLLDMGEAVVLYPKDNVQQILRAEERMVSPVGAGVLSFLDRQTGKPK